MGVTMTLSALDDYKNKTIYKGLEYYTFRYILH